MKTHHDHRADTTTVTLDVPRLYDRAQLVAELDAAGYVLVSGERDGTSITATFEGIVDPDPILELVAAHEPSNVAQLDVLVEKAQRVWAGEESFTQPQAQKILAGLVLVVARYLR